MSQIYLQRFEYRDSVDRSAIDQAWDVANEAMAKTGNWGNVETGVRHIHGYGTDWGGYVLIEVNDAAAFNEYQMFHSNNYSHVARITFESLVDLDVELAPVVAEIKAKA